jgi:hypothetical protein
MGMTQIEITDRVGTSGTVIVAAHDIAETIRPWYSEAPADVLDAIEELQAKILRGEDATAEAEFLGVLVHGA